MAPTLEADQIPVPERADDRQLGEELVLPLRVVATSLHRDNVAVPRQHALVDGPERAVADDPVGVEALRGGFQLPVAELLRHLDDVRGEGLRLVLLDFLGVHPYESPREKSQEEGAGGDHAGDGPGALLAELVVAGRRRRLVAVLPRSIGPRRGRRGRRRRTGTRRRVHQSSSGRRRRRLRGRIEGGAEAPPLNAVDLGAPLRRPGEADVHEFVHVLREIEIHGQNRVLRLQIRVRDGHVEESARPVEDDPSVDQVAALEIDVDRAQVADLRRHHGVQIQAHVVAVDVPELDVHERVELHRHEGGGGGRAVEEAEEPAGPAEEVGIGGDEEGEAAADGGRVEVGDREGEEGGEARGGAGPGLPEADGLREEGPTGAGVGDGEVASEPHAAVQEVRVAQELEAAQRQRPEVERCAAGGGGGGGEKGPLPHDGGGVEKTEREQSEGDAREAPSSSIPHFPKLQ